MARSPEALHHAIANSGPLPQSARSRPAHGPRATTPRRALAFGYLALGAACAGAGSPAAPADRLANIALTAARINAGQTGRAILVPLGERTQVTIIVSGLPPQLTSRPVHLYTLVYRGVCGNLPSQPAYALTDRVLTQPPAPTVAAGPLTITNVAPVSMADLYERAHAIVVATSPADGSREVFCGDIR